MNLLQLSWKNLLNKPLSMVLSLVLFALGIGLISLLFLLQRQLGDKFDKNLAGIDMVVGAKGSPLQLILCNMYHVDAPTGNIATKEAEPFIRPALIKKAVPLSIGDSYKGYRIVGTNKGIIDLYEAQLASGQWWVADFEVTIGADIANTLDLEIGDTFQSSHGFVLDDNLVHEDAHPFKVIGIMKPTGAVIDQLILSSTQSILKVHGHGETEHDHDHEEHNHEDHDHKQHEEHNHGDHDHDHDHEEHNQKNSTVKNTQSNNSNELLEGVAEEITALLIQFKTRNFQTLNLQRYINENTNLQAATPAIEINRLRSNVGVGEQAIRALAYIIAFVSGLSIFIALFSSLKERKYELALMRTMGASRSKIFFLIILEGILLALVGCIVGFVLGHLAMSILGYFMEDAYRYAFTGWTFLKQEYLLLLSAIAIGLIAALIPAIQAARTDISDTLAKG